MNTNPLVSIVTPVFNGERYISETIESVLAQTYKNIEYIVVDGASTDKTVELAKRRGSGIAKLTSEPDNGMYDAINKGLRQSSGDIVCYLNADDIFFPETVELVVHRFLRGDVDLVFGNCVFIDEHSAELYRSRGVDLSHANLLVLQRIPFCQPTAFWTRTLYDRVDGFDQRYRYVADTHFFYRALRVAGTRRAHIDHYLASFRVHGGGFSAKAAAAMTREHEEVMAELGGSHGALRFVMEAYVKWRNGSNLIKKALRRAPR
jgi:glycosyltransferase involved in cell wall biosynthesis